MPRMKVSQVVAEIVTAHKGWPWAAECAVARSARAVSGSERTIVRNREVIRALLVRKELCRAYEGQLTAVEAAHK